MAEGGLLAELSEDQVQDLQSYLVNRFEILNTSRKTLDDEIAKEIERFNGKDELIDAKLEHEAKVKENYLYDLVQTMVGRLIQTLFPDKNYLKIFVEHPMFRKVERDLTGWIQEELDRLKIRARARDFLEEALVGRLSWLHLRPVPTKRMGKSEGKMLPIEGYRAEFDVFNFFDVWFDTKATDPEQTDYFVKKTKKLYQLYQNRDIYMNLDQVEPSTGGEDDDAKRTDAYEAKHGSAASDSTTPAETERSTGVKATDEVELLEYYGVYDFSEGDSADPDWEPDVKEVICTLANRRILIRAEVNDLPTKRKRLMFPIRPLRMGKSLIGKSIPQLVGDNSHDLNDILSLQMDNFKLLVKLLFKYNKNADIDIEELFAGDGNAIGWDESKDDIDVIQIPNVLQLAGFMAAEKRQSMQSTAGTPDVLMGQAGGRGAPETATGIGRANENALFKFGIIALNVADDLIEFIKYVMILLVQNNPGAVFMRWPNLGEFLALPPEQLELDYIADLELRDLSTRRELERQQIANLAGIIGPLLQQNGGNMSLFLKNVMTAFNLEDIDEMMEMEDPSQIAAKLLNNPQLAQAVQQIVAAEQGAANRSRENVGSTPGVPTEQGFNKTAEGQTI